MLLTSFTLLENCMIILISLDILDVMMKILSLFKLMILLLCEITFRCRLID